jgi:hypothetical protein
LCGSLRRLFSVAALQAATAVLQAATAVQSAAVLDFAMLHVAAVQFAFVCVLDGPGVKRSFVDGR